MAHYVTVPPGPSLTLRVLLTADTLVCGGRATVYDRTGSTELGSVVMGSGAGDYSVPLPAPDELDGARVICDFNVCALDGRNTAGTIEVRAVVAGNEVPLTPPAHVDATDWARCQQNQFDPVRFPIVLSVAS